MSSTQSTTHGTTNTGRLVPIALHGLGSEKLSLHLSLNCFQLCQLFTFAICFFPTAYLCDHLCITCYNVCRIIYTNISQTDTIDILDQMILCYGTWSVYYRIFFFCSIWLYPLDYIANLINQHYSQHCQKSPGRQDQAPHLTNTGSHWHLCIYTLIHSINVYRMHAMCQILEYNSKKKDIVLALSCL